MGEMMPMSVFIAVPLFIVIMNFGIWIRLYNWRNPYEKYFTKTNIIFHIITTIIATIWGIGVNIL
jgi:riboflavin transporter FmnP